MYIYKNFEERSKLLMCYKHTNAELADLFYQALSLFNTKLETDICKDNIHLCFFTPMNGIEIYKAFCMKHFPKYLSEAYTEDGYFDSLGAQAFLNDREYGVLIRSDIDYSNEEVFLMFLHEISHLFCARNEIEGGNFYDKYCMSTGAEDGMMNAGYAIWREAIADILADSILTDYATISLEDVHIRDEIISLYSAISVDNPDSKKAMSLVTSYTMLSKQVAGTTSWKKAEKELKKHITIDDMILFEMLKQVFEQLHTHPYWRITPDFIISLGAKYLDLVMHKQFRKIIIDCSQDH